MNCGYGFVPGPIAVPFTAIYSGSRAKACCKGEEWGAAGLSTV